MTPINFVEANTDFGQPENWPGDVAPVNTLPALQGIDQEGLPFVLSIWQPTPEELTMLNNGGGVALVVVGGGMPPVKVYGVSLKQINNEPNEPA